MKKNIMPVFAVLILLSGIVYAQEPVPPAQKAAPVEKAVKKSSEKKTAIGKIESITLADAAKATKSEIMLTGDDGQKHTFIVKTTTTIYDASWKPISLDKLKANDRVKVKYSIAKEGPQEALSISIAK